MSKTIIISGFPGIGKTFFANECKSLKVLDLKSSTFHYKKDPFGIAGPVKLEDSEWVKNYVDVIVYNRDFGNCESGFYDYILISSHRAVREELRNRGIDYIVVIPKGRDRNEYMRRFLCRGSSMEFMKTLFSNWADWICEILDYETMPVIALESGEYLTDIFKSDPWQYL